MSTTARHGEAEVWQPPATYREGLADAERVAALLVAQVAGQQALLVPSAQIEFLAKRLHTLVLMAYRALPPEVV